jgi:hypothetical protein
MTKRVSLKLYTVVESFKAALEWSERVYKYENDDEEDMGNAEDFECRYDKGAHRALYNLASIFRDAYDADAVAVSSPNCEDDLTKLFLFGVCGHGVGLWDGRYPKEEIPNLLAAEKENRESWVFELAARGDFVRVRCG